MAHGLVCMVRDVQGTQYVGKGYRSEFTCPTCKRSSWQHLSFLGRRKMACNGVKIHKLSAEELRQRSPESLKPSEIVRCWFETWGLEIGPAEENLFNELEDLEGQR